MVVVTATIPTLTILLDTARISYDIREEVYMKKNNPTNCKYYI
jgi:hypothetical protein